MATRGRLASGAADSVAPAVVEAVAAASGSSERNEVNGCALSSSGISPHTSSEQRVTPCCTQSRATSDSSARVQHRPVGLCGLHHNCRGTGQRSHNPTMRARPPASVQSSSGGGPSGGWRGRLGARFRLRVSVRCNPTQGHGTRGRGELRTSSFVDGSEQTARSAAQSGS